MYDATIGRWLSQDPIGFAAGDGNLYRYVRNQVTVQADPSGLEPAGNNHPYPLYLGGSYNQPVFPLTEVEHTAFHDYFRDNRLARTTGVTWEQARSNWSDLTVPERREIIRQAMRAANIPDAMIRSRMDAIMEGASWPEVENRSRGRPPGYRAGQVVPRAAIEEARAAAAGRPGPRGTIRLRAMGVMGVYLALRDACQAAGVLPPERIVYDEDYLFTADDGSVFVVTPRRLAVPALALGVATIMGVEPTVPPRRRFVAGPRAGRVDEITDERVEAYRTEAEVLYGRYIPGGLFRGARFIPGTIRQRLPIIDERTNHHTGYIDETGTHYYPPPRLPVVPFT